MSKRIYPLGKNVLAKKLITNETISKGIVRLAQSHRDDKYVAIAVGPGVSDIFPGDTIYIHPTAPSEYVKYGGDTFRHVSEENIYAKEDE